MLLEKVTYQVKKCNFLGKTSKKLQYAKEGLFMLTKGFIEQQIEIIANALGSHIGKERLVHELTDPYRNEAANDLNRRLMELLADGRLNEAEDLLFKAVQYDEGVDHDYLRVALDFYLKLDEFDEDELKQYNFSREEATTGWTEITKLF